MFRRIVLGSRWEIGPGRTCAIPSTINESGSLAGDLSAISMNPSRKFPTKPTFTGSYDVSEIVMMIGLLETTAQSSGSWRRAALVIPELANRQAEHARFSR